MVRKSCFIGFSYLAGLVVCNAAGGIYLTAFALIVIGLGGIVFTLNKKLFSTVIACFVAIFVAVLMNFLYTQFHINRLLELDGKDVTVTGYVSEYSYIGDDSELLTVKGKVNGISTQISFYVDNNKYDYYDRVSVTGKVYKIRDSINFQTNKYSASKGVYLQGENADIVVYYRQNANPLFREVKHFRDYLSGKIIDVCGKDAGSFLSAMLCGEKTGMTAHTKQLLYHSGIGHIFSVSGTHVIIITSVLAFVFDRIMKNRRRKSVVLLTIVWIFAVFAGFSASVVRACIMMTFIKMSELFGREGDCANSLGLAVIVLTIFSPYASVDSSLLLSAASAFAIGVISPKLEERVRLKGILGTLTRLYIPAVTVLIFTIPLQLAFFGGVSVIAPITNIILVPICTFALTLTVVSALFGGIGAAVLPLIAAKYLVRAVLYISSAVVDIPYAYIVTGSGFLSIFIVLTGAVPFVYMICGGNVAKGLCGAVAAISLWCGAAGLTMSMNKEYKIMVFSGEKGAQAVVTKGGRALLFDVGSKGYYDSGEKRYMEHIGINFITAGFIFSQSEMTVDTMKNDFASMPKYIYCADSSKAGIAFKKGLLRKCSGLEIKSVSDGFTIATDEVTLEINHNSICVNGKNHDISKEQYPLIIDGKGMTRIDYGFNHCGSTS